MKSIRNIAAMLACCLALSPLVGFAETAESFLTQRGLIQQQKNWLLPLEVELQQNIRRLPKQEANLIAMQNNARRIAQSLLAVHSQTATRIAIAEKNVTILRAAREELNSAGRRKFVDSRIKSEQEKIASLRNSYVESDMIAGLPVVRQAMIQLTNSRNDMAATLMWIHDSRPMIRQEYDKLASDQQVASALKRIGDDQQLGSGEDYDSPAFLRKLAQYEQEVFTDELPLYRAGGELRVAAFIHRTPVTFIWHTSGEPTMLPASVIEAAGLKVPADAVEMKQRFPDGKELTVRQFEIPYMRFGRHVLKNVTALALPPEGEQYGAQIGPAAFDEHSPVAQPERMRLLIR